MKLFRGRKKPRKVTIKPDGSVDLTGYTLAEMMRMARHPAFQKVLLEARENPPVEAEIRDVG
jgi:hypothetical protein